MRRVIWAASISALLLIDCGRRDVAGSTEIGNPTETAILTGILTDPAGTPRPNVRAELYPASYIPPSALAKRAAADSIYSVQSDSLGGFRFEGVTLGAYNLICRNNAGDSAILRAVSLTQAQVSAGRCTLNATGVLSSYAIVDALGGTGSVGIYVPGSPFGVKSTDSAAALLSGVPVGVHAIVFRGDSGSASATYHIAPAETTYAAPVAVDHDTLVSLPPMVGNVQAHLNGTQDTVSIRWLDPHATGNQFLVYRQLHADSVGHPINNGHFHPVTGQPGYFEYLDPRSSIPTAGHYVYWVRQRDSVGRMGEPGHSLAISIP